MVATLLVFCLQTPATTTDPDLCVGDTDNNCEIITADGGCYNPDTEEVCCQTCATLLDTEAPANCR